MKRVDVIKKAILANAHITFVLHINGFPSIITLVRGPEKPLTMEY